MGRACKKNGCREIIHLRDDDLHDVRKQDGVIKNTWLTQPKTPIRRKRIKHTEFVFLNT